MDSRQLRYFIAVYEQRNLSRAADQVNVAQSALSHHISNLEAEFATPLFERKSRGMEPTAAGERLYEHARIILRAMAEAETEVREGARVIAGEISIGMANSGVKAIGVALMRTVLTKYPKLKLSLTESLSGATLMHLMVSNVDLALVYNPPSEKELITEAVLEEEMFLVGIPKLVGKGKAPIRFEELNRLPLILLRYGLGLSSRALLDDPVLLKRLEGGAILHANSITGMTGALVEGLGCTIATITPKTQTGGEGLPGHACDADQLDLARAVRPRSERALRRGTLQGCRRSRAPARGGEISGDVAQPHLAIRADHRAVVDPCGHSEASRSWS